MTRTTQKHREKLIAEAYLKVARLSGDLQLREGPDFELVSDDGRIIGIEVCEYARKDDLGGFSHRQVEAEWENIRKLVVEYRRENPDLDNLSVYLDFSEKRVPAKREQRKFVEHIHKLIVRNGSRIPPSAHTYIAIEEHIDEFLSRYLKQIRVKPVRAYLEWDWNHSFAGVGTDDWELVETVEKKLSYDRNSLDELHLVVAGGGATIGSYIGYLHPDLMDTFVRFNNRLEESNVDTVAILNGDDSVVWRRTDGWSSFGSPD